LIRKKTTKWENLPFFRTIAGERRKGKRAVKGGVIASRGRRSFNEKKQKDIVISWVKDTGSGGKSRRGTGNLEKTHRGAQDWQSDKFVRVFENRAIKKVAKESGNHIAGSLNRYRMPHFWGQGGGRI